MSQLAIAFDEAPQESPDTGDLLDLLPASFGAARWALQAMEWAEDEIEAAKRRHPVEALLLDRAFIVLRPRSEMFAKRPESVTRSHMQEMLNRIAKGSDVGPGTAAECCLALSYLSEAAPLHERYRTAYHVFFFDAFGAEQATETMGEEVVRRLQLDREHSTILDIMDEMQRATADEERAKDWKAKLAHADS
jgi:hypothetical protein